ncbi:hypothetical protein KEM48_001898 [Puccinia striiformis f. sp. tritici PST-130]|nr:hypothetical protein KEM48_001898 [Puccinia striiformis f. sp. tritici PST-130]
MKDRVAEVSEKGIRKRGCISCVYSSSPSEQLPHSPDIFACVVSRSENPARHGFANTGRSAKHQTLGGKDWIKVHSMPDGTFFPTLLLTILKRILPVVLILASELRQHPHGPVKMTVEETADKTTLIDLNQAIPISSQQNIPPQNPNRYKTNASRSCEDPKVTILLPSAPDRGVVLRSSHLVPPMWLTERPHGALPVPGTPPRTLPTELKRKIPDTDSRISSSEFHSSAVSNPLDQVGTTAQRGFQLFGFTIEPEGYAKKCKGVERMGDPAEIKTTPIPGSLSEADSSSIDISLPKPHVGTSSPSLSVTPKLPSISSVSRQTTVRVHENMSGHEVQVSKKDQTAANTKLERMTFDVNLFKSFASLTSSGYELPSKLTDLFRLCGGGELVMTEDQFVRHAGTAFRHYKLPNAAQIYPGRPFSEATSISRMRNQSAVQFLVENIPPWRSRYEGKLEFNLRSFIIRISGISHKTINSGLEKLIVSYLNFVEMISTMVPRDKKTNDINFELKEALQLLESVDETKEPHKFKYSPPSESQRSVIKEIFRGTSTGVRNSTSL